MTNERGFIDDDELTHGIIGALAVALQINRQDIRDQLVQQNITGSELWMFYQDVCHGDMATLNQMVEQGTAKAALMALTWYEHGTSKKRRPIVDFGDDQ